MARSGYQSATIPDSEDLLAFGIPACRTLDLSLVGTQKDRGFSRRRKDGRGILGGVNLRRCKTWERFREPGAFLHIPEE